MASAKETSTLMLQATARGLAVTSPDATRTVPWVRAIEVHRVVDGLTLGAWSVHQAQDLSALEDKLGTLPDPLVGSVAEELVLDPSADTDRVEREESRFACLWARQAARGYQIDTALAHTLVDQGAAARSIVVADERLAVHDDVAVARVLRNFGIAAPKVEGQPRVTLDWLRRHTGSDDRGAASVIAQIVQARSAVDGATVARSILRHTDPEGRVHPVICPLGADTGRMTVSEPALQGLSPCLRRLVLAEPGHVWVGADLSRVEPSIMAMLSQDKRMISDLEGQFYEWTAERLATSRPIAKQVFMAAAYGAGDDRIARLLGFTGDDAATKASQARALMLQPYETLSGWMRALADKAAQTGTVATHQGRILHPPYPNAAVAYVVQGTGRDLLRHLTLRTVDALDTSGIPWSSVLALHDELQVAVPAHHAAAAADTFCRLWNLTPRGVKVHSTIATSTGRNLEKI